jgi:group I intron endonuclease
MQMICGIYEIRNTVNNKFYIGSSSNIRRRFSDHRSCLYRGIHNNNHLQQSWCKYGEPAFEFKLLFIVDKDNLCLFEQRTIDILKPQYNKSMYVEKFALGMKKSPEEREKIRQRHLGKHTSENQKLAVAKANASRVWSEESKSKITESLTGKKRAPFSEEWKYKLGATYRGKHLSQEHRKKIGDSNANGLNGCIRDWHGRILKRI